LIDAGIEAVKLQVGPGWLRFATVILCSVIVGAVFLASQSAEETMSDAEKRQRIEALYEKYERKFPQVEGIRAVDLKADLERGRRVVLVDVRKPEEQAVSMIPGAITQQEFEEQEESHQGETIVTYCTAGYRSGLYAKKLQKRGWQVLNLEGSLLAWTHAGGTLVDDGGPTKRVHVYSADWSLEAADYDPVW
jgi:rhodanese-related sulfurtransferase